MLTFCLLQNSWAQEKKAIGVITASVLDLHSKPIESANVVLSKKSDADSSRKYRTSTDKLGQFQLSNIEFGIYKLTITHIGFQALIIDSINFRAERADFNLNDLVMKSGTNDTLQNVVIYAEKPLIESKDGNITFNAGESAAAAGATASELLTQVPLVSKDADGKVTMKGKEPKILIDDKPVELNLQQLQDLLESMPGSSIEKIEVMTNPPPQYANEPGGVINIVTKKGKVGKSGRISITGGTRGETAVNASFNYRKNKLSLGVNAGYSQNSFQGNGYSIRQNIYTDSTNHFNTTTDYTNKSKRPNVRVNLDYDITKKDILNTVITFNQNDFDNHSNTVYKNINRFDALWKLSERSIDSKGESVNPGINLSYTHKGKPGETFRLIGAYNFTTSTNNRDFYQQYFNPDYSSNGLDSFQRQNNSTRVGSYTVRTSYDKMLKDKKTFLSVGGYFSQSDNHVVVDASYKKKPEGIMLPSEPLSNDFIFHQSIGNIRASVRHNFRQDFSFTIGNNAEHTSIKFDLLKTAQVASNGYWTWLPFFNLNRTWKEKLSITLSYRRTINRPGINEMNPSIDYSDPYNIRFGNSNLTAATSHNFDLVFGRVKPKYFVNLGFGHNIVQDVFSHVRSLTDQGKTQITYENISGRKEYEMSSWNGITLSKKFRMNLSASMTRLQYSSFDRLVRKFRNGTSLTSTFGYSYNPTDLISFTGNFNLNRFASPQGFAKWSTSLNIGLQKKFLHKKLIVSLNAIDPLTNQKRKTFTYGTNFNLENYSLTYTRNYRATIAYVFSAKPKKLPASKKPVKK